jgi:integrating conjugative element protein (TIGR03757 family)
MRTILLAASLLAAPAFAAGARIEVFTVSSLPVSAPAGMPVYRIDRLRGIEAELSAGLPRDPQQAARIAQARIRARGDELERDALAAGTGAGLALHYGLDRVPAIVIDGRYVVFGERSVEAALAHWRQAPQKAAP